LRQGRDRSDSNGKSRNSGEFHDDEYMNIVDG
jgi:hypothetical protein